MKTRKWKRTRARIAAASRNIKKAIAARVATSESRREQLGYKQRGPDTAALRPQQQQFGGAAKESNPFSEIEMLRDGNRRLRQERDQLQQELQTWHLLRRLLDRLL